MSSTKIWSQEMWDLLPSSASLSADMWHEQSAKCMNNDDTDVWKATNDCLPWILHHTLAFSNHNTSCSMWHSCRGYKEKIWLELSSTEIYILGARSMCSWGQRGLCWNTILDCLPRYVNNLRYIQEALFCSLSLACTIKVNGYDSFIVHSEIDQLG